MQTLSNKVLGIDFDNTLASYGEALHRLALEWRLIDASVDREKSQIREHVRQQQDGEIQWQKLQGAVYGPEIGQAKLSDGVPSFFSACRNNGCQVYVISHKTRFAAQDETRTNLRTAAMDWMTGHHFFAPGGLGLSQDNIFFEDTRRKKVGRIKSLRCTHLIDDLEETFLEDTLPQQVSKILYAPNGPESRLPGVKTARTWLEITSLVFDASD